MGNANEFEHRRRALLAEIAAAFDGVSREGGTTLHEAVALDDRESLEEQQAARRLDTELRWQDVPDEDIFACCSALSFLNEKGFRYYIPAFMTFGLRRWEDDWNMILNSCVHHLLQDYPKSLRQSDPAAIAGKFQFTAAQSRAVASFLRFVIDFDQTQAAPSTVQAIEKWERYVAAR